MRSRVRVRTRFAGAMVVAVGMLGLLPCIAQAVTTVGPGIGIAGTVPGTYAGLPVTVQVAGLQACAGGSSSLLVLWSGGGMFSETLGASQNNSCSNFDSSGDPQTLSFAGTGSTGGSVAGTIYGPGSANPPTFGFSITTASGKVLNVPQAAPLPWQGAPGRVQPYPAPATSLEFAQQPTNTIVNQPITPAVKVQLANSSASGVPVTIAIGNNPGGATLSGTTTENTVNGVATFSNLSLNEQDLGYSLTASSPGMTGDSSTPFDINAAQTNCNTSMDCLLTLIGPTSTLSIDAGPNNGQLEGQIDPGTPMDGPGSNPKLDPGCSGYTPQNPDWYVFDVVNQVDESGPPAKSVTWTVKNATPDGFMVCFGSTSSFEAILAGEIGTAEGGTLPDGMRGYVGFLPYCDQFDNSSDVPCITDDPLLTREDGNSTTGQDVIVDVSIPADFPGDPAMGRG